MSEPTERLYERVLVLRCQAGDEGAFTELVQRYQPCLQYYLRKMLRDAAAVEDTLQEVWLDVFRGMVRLVDAGAFRAWLYRVARDRALRLLRKRRLPCQPLAECDLPAPDEESAHFSAEDAADIHVALDALAVEHREILVLRFLEDMSYDEIAEVAGCPVGTVRSRLYYAKRALRGVLERTNVHD